MFNAIFLTYLYVYAQARKKRDVSSTRLIRERQHFSRNVMVSVAISKMGKSCIVVIELDAKVNSQYYCRNVLGDGLLPDIRAICQHHNLQQDGDPSHTAKNTMEYLRRENISFIEPDMWPPNSPDLNPVDYAVWGALQQMVYRRRSFTRPTVDQLKETIVTEWTNPDSNVRLAQWWPDFEFPQRATTWATAPSRHGARSSILYWPDVSATALDQHSAPVQARHRFSPPDQRSTGARLQDPVWLSVGFSHRT